MPDEKHKRRFKIKFMTPMLLFLLVFSIINSVTFSESTEEILTFYGVSDASAAVALDEETFIVADDEDNLLRVYKVRNNSYPVFAYDLSRSLDLTPEHPETDIEGATIIGNRAYWITSHGRNKDGQMRPNRYRFFATTVKVDNEIVTIEPIGVPCETLAHALVIAGSICQSELEQAAGFGGVKSAERHNKNLAPHKKGLNIEGLCASADGRTIYIGLRNPLFCNKVTIRTRAIVVPLNNPAEVIEKAAVPVFGNPLLWDLEGRGIRSMEYSHSHKAYFIVAGAPGKKIGFALYRWSGEKNEAPLLVQEIHSDRHDFNPEALVAFKNSDRFLLLSDDGELAVDISNASECIKGKSDKNRKCLNKYLTKQNRKHFRGIRLKP